MALDELDQPQGTADRRAGVRVLPRWQMVTRQRT
jgi:hypothetical protein